MFNGLGVQVNGPSKEFGLCAWGDRLGVDGVGAEELAQDRLRGLLIGCSDRMVAKAH